MARSRSVAGFGFFPNGCAVGHAWQIARRTPRQPFRTIDAERLRSRDTGLKGYPITRCRGAARRPRIWCGVLIPGVDLDWDRFGKVDYLYVSHLHQDHFDPVLLSKHVSRDATVLLPDSPVFAWGHMLSTR